MVRESIESVFNILEFHNKEQSNGPIFTSYHRLDEIAFYNLRLTTRECVHLVTRGHFRSRHNNGGHTIRSVVAENLMVHANLIALSFIERELWAIEVLHCGNWDFLNFFAPATLTLTR